MMREFDYQNFATQYDLDEETKSLLAKIYELRSRQETFANVQNETLEKLIEIAKIQSIESSNYLEGIFTTNSRLQSIVKQKTSPRNRNEEEIAGYRDVLNIIHENYEYISITPNYILQLHETLYSKCQFQRIKMGYKATNNTINEIKPDGNSVVIFNPLEAALTPIAMQYLCEEFNKALDTKAIEPLLAIPMFIHDFYVSIHLKMEMVV